ncbi:MAG: RHS repeat-associated core domain-containing protein [Candidatus Omnitrophota bacterium]
MGSLFERITQINTDGSQINTDTKHVFMGSQRIASVKTRGDLVTTTYFHSDHLGSSNVLTDQSGNQVALYEYSPFGEVSTRIENPGSSISYLFTGKELDDSTGLYFYGARYYDPEIGRFITPDSIVQAPSDPQSLNRYSYCRNNPLNYIDPSGHFWFIGIIIGAILGGISSAVNHQPIWQGMLMGALGGVLVAGGGALAAEMGFSAGWGATAGGIVGGIANFAVNGGNIGVGALTGGLGAAIGYGLGNWAAGWNSGSFWGQLGGAAIAGAVAGGVGAELSGGKFGQGAWMGAAFSTAGFLGSYGGNSLDPQVVKGRTYERQSRQIHALNAKKNDMIKVPVGNRSVSFFKPAQHKFLPDWQMGPLDGRIATTNTAGDLSKWPTHIETQNAIKANTADYATAEVSASGLVEAETLYENTWARETTYYGSSYNSNYAVNTVIYSAGGNNPGAFWTPEFRGSTLYYFPDPYSDRK